MNIIERIARHADIDTRLAMGFMPRKLPPSNLTIKQGIKKVHCDCENCRSLEHTEVSLSNSVVVTAFQDGVILWGFYAVDDCGPHIYRRP